MRPLCLPAAAWRHPGCPTIFSLLSIPTPILSRATPPARSLRARAAPVVNGLVLEAGGGGVPDQRLAVHAGADGEGDEQPVPEWHNRQADLADGARSGRHQHEDEGGQAVASEDGESDAEAGQQGAEVAAEAARGQGRVLACVIEVSMKFHKSFMFTTSPVKISSSSSGRPRMTRRKRNIM